MLIDDCPVFRSELVERPIFLEPSRVSQLRRRTVLDRKLDDVGVAGFPPSGSDEAKLPNQVIEGGSEVVDGIPDEDSHSADGIFRDGCCCPEDVIAATMLVFKPHGYSVSIGDRGGDSKSGFAAKRVEMLFGPLDFSPDTGEVRLVARGR
jgi:hypothetical protein